jgi:hypothetical protein
VTYVTFWAVGLGLSYALPVRAEPVFTGFGDGWRAAGWVKWKPAGALICL